MFIRPVNKGKFNFFENNQISEEAMDQIVNAIRAICNEDGEESVVPSYYAGLIGTPGVKLIGVSRQLDSKNTPIAAIIFTDDDMANTTMPLHVYCANRGLGGPIFKEFLNWMKTHPSLMRIKRIDIESVLPQIGFWRKMGFKFVNERNAQTSYKEILDMLPTDPHYEGFFKPKLWIPVWFYELYDSLNRVDSIGSRDEFIRKTTIKYPKPFKVPNSFAKTKIDIGNSRLERDIKERFFDAFKGGFTRPSKEVSTDRHTGNLMRMHYNVPIKILDVLESSVCATCEIDSDNLYQEANSDLIFCNSYCQRKFHAQKDEFEILAGSGNVYF